MNIRIEKKNADKYLIIFGNEYNIEGKYFSKSELKKLQNNINEIIEYDEDEVGDSI